MAPAGSPNPPVPGVPSTDSFIFAGHDMKKDFGIWMTKSDTLIPTQRKQFVTIPFRDGSYEFPGDYYDNRTISVDCDTRNGMTRDRLRYLVRLFAIKSPIVFWDEPNRFYRGKIYEDKGFKDMCRFIREFTLTFLCDPFAYGNTITKQLPTSGAISYGGTIRTPTRLEITNTHPTLDITRIRVRIRSRNGYPDPFAKGIF